VLGLTTLGLIHTAISLVALVSGIWALARDKQIVLANRLGKLYLVTTVLTAATGLVIFEHGGFRIGHLFAILTLAVVALGTVAATSSLFGRASRYIQATCYSSTILLHMITGIAETLTRLPPDAPLITASNASIFKGIISALVLLFLVGLTFQLRRLRARSSRKSDRIFHSLKIPRISGLARTAHATYRKPTSLHRVSRSIQLTGGWSNAAAESLAA
jgi:uncharacterized membrane protein